MIKYIILNNIMYLIPLVRSGRAISSCLLFPDNPIQAIAVSELISYIGPFVNFNPFNINIIGFTMYLIFDPDYAQDLIQIYKNEHILYYKLELILLTIFLVKYNIFY